MGISSQAIRLFISSTFSDFQLERDVLQRLVFPELGRLCRARGVEFQAVDLRWGINEDEAREQRTLSICLREVQRCLEVSPRPNFLILLGERYGWQPVPPTIPERDFEDIERWLGNRAATGDIVYIRRWYKRDANALTPHHRLQSRRDITDGSHWRDTEERLREILRKAVEGLTWRSPRTDRYMLSATAQEIMRGTLRTGDSSNDVRDHVFCFYRRRLGPRPNIAPPLSGDYNDLDGSQPNPDAAERLSELIRRLKKLLGNNFLPYQAFAVDGDGISTHHLDAFARDSFALLSAVIEDELDRLSRITPLERERGRHRTFLEEKIKQFVGRRALIDAIVGNRTGRRIIVLHGAGGVGKSSVVAKALTAANARGWRTTYRFVGLTSSSSNGPALLRNLCEELAPPSPADKAAEGFAHWSDRFKSLIGRMEREPGPIHMVAIDALDQLPNDDPGRSFDWIPRKTPENVLMLVSTTDGEVLDALRHRLPDGDFMRLGSLEASSARLLLKNWLRTERRRLQSRQMSHALGCFAKSGLPLHLRLIAEEATLWTSPPDNPDQPEMLAEDVEGMVRQILARLSSPCHHGDLMVRRTLGYIAAARHGLTESELIGVLSADEEVMERFRDSSPQGRDLQRLPFIIWSRMRDSLEPYLSERQADGLPAIGFFHRIFREVVEKEYLSPEEIRAQCHSRLAHFFGEGDFARDFLDVEGRSTPNLRRLSELPFHLLHAGRLSDLACLLSKREYFSAKFRAGQRYDLFTEYLECHSAQVRTGLVTDSLRLAADLARQIVDHAVEDDTMIDIEDVHAFLAFRKDTSLYRQVLDEAVTALDGMRDPASVRLRLGMRARQGNLLRRDGDLDRAAALLKEILPAFAAAGPSAELARVEYDLGYIDFLRGDLELGAAFIQSSAETARLSGNEAGEWISRCVAAYHRWQLAWHDGDDRDAAIRLLAVVDNAFDIFDRWKFDNTTCERWVMNVHAMRFVVAFRHDDVAAAKESFNRLATDPWLEEFDDGISLERCRAKVLVMEGSFAVGAIKLEEIATVRRANSVREEALAEDYVDAGEAYLRAHDNRSADRMFKASLELPSSFGNILWQRRARTFSKSQLVDLDLPVEP